MPLSQELQARLAAAKKKSEANSAGLLVLITEHSSRATPKRAEKRVVKRARRESAGEEVTLIEPLQQPVFSLGLGLSAQVNTATEDDASDPRMGEQEEASKRADLDACLVPVPKFVDLSANSPRTKSPTRSLTHEFSKTTLAPASTPAGNVAPPEVRDPDKTLLRQDSGKSLMLPLSCPFGGKPSFPTNQYREPASHHEGKAVED